MVKMTSRQRLECALRGERPDRPANFDIVMAYGARRIGLNLRDYYLDARALARMNLAMLEEMGLDIVQAISDPYREAIDWGLEVEFHDDALPMRVRPLLREPEDAARLVPPNPAAGRRMSDRLEAIRLMKAQVGGEVPVMGWVEGALAEANDLRGDSALMTDFYDRPEWLADLLERLTEVEIAFARAQIEAGADIIGLGDAIASTISPKMYRAFALPYEQRIFAAVSAIGAVGRLHICGDTNRIVTDMAKSGAQIIDVDWMVDFGRAAQVFGAEGVAICGNVDPVRVMLQGTPGEVYKGVWDNLAAGGSRAISAAGCEIPPGTPDENIQAQNRAIREFLP